MDAVSISILLKLILFFKSKSDFNVFNILPSGLLHKKCSGEWNESGDDIHIFRTVLICGLFPILITQTTHFKDLNKENGEQGGVSSWYEKLCICECRLAIYCYFGICVLTKKEGVDSG